MKELLVDVAIIGHGTAGSRAYHSAIQHTDKIVIINGGSYGTTCARVGCMPSKLLIAAAEKVHEMQTSDQFGVHLDGKIHINGKEVMKRVREMRDFFVSFVLKAVEDIPAEHRITGYAKFLDPHTLQVDDHTTVQADRIVIATGSDSIIPGFLKDINPPSLPLQGRKKKRVITNDDVFYWEDLPVSVAVFGTGIIAMELGQALHRLGVRVTLFGRSGRITTLSDPDLQEYATKIFSEELDLTSQAEVLDVTEVKDGVQMHYRNKKTNEEKTAVYEYVLAATGRFANVKNLDIEKSGLQLNDKGVPLYSPQTMQCGESHIFLAGDANGELQLLHEAADEGIIAGDNAGRFPDVQSGQRRSKLAVVFTDPQIATLGSSYKDLQERSFVTGEVNFEKQGRSQVMAKNKGLLHLYADKKTGRLLGAEMMGPKAENISHLLAWAHQNEMILSEMLDMPFYHPTVEEGLRDALRDAAQKIKT